MPPWTSSPPAGRDRHTRAAGRGGDSRARERRCDFPVSFRVPPPDYTRRPPAACVIAAKPNSSPITRTKHWVVPGSPTRGRTRTREQRGRPCNSGGVQMRHRDGLGWQWFRFRKEGCQRSVALAGRRWDGWDSSVAMFSALARPRAGPPGGAAAVGRQVTLKPP